MRKRTSASRSLSKPSTPPPATDDARRESGASPGAGAPESVEPPVSRRRFLALVAAGSVAIGSATDALAADPAARHAKGAAHADGKAKPAKPTADIYPAPPAPSAKIAKGLEESRESLTKQLARIRSYDLPPGSEQGFAFRPLRPAKPARAERGAR